MEIILDVRDSAENTRFYVPMAPFRVSGYANGKSCFRWLMKQYRKESTLCLKNQRKKTFRNFTRMNGR